MMVDGLRFFSYLYTVFNALMTNSHEPDSKNPLQK
jgi:hypothetical protein